MKKQTYAFYHILTGLIISNYHWVSNFKFENVKSVTNFYSVNRDWYAVVNSLYLFSSIVKSIGECASLVKVQPKKVPQKTFKRNPNNKFQKRFNMGGSGLETGQIPSSSTPKIDS